MKTSFLILALFLVNFSNCKSSKNMDRPVSTAIETITTGAYFQKWVAGIKGGGAGINLYIPASALKHIGSFELGNPEGRRLKAVYFREKKTTLSLTSLAGEAVYFGFFKTDLNAKETMLMMGDQKGEYGNKTPLQEPKVEPPVTILENEALIVYTENNLEKYLKISGIVEKPLMAMPYKSRNSDDY
jgi:hypothetical protein